MSKSTKKKKTHGTGSRAPAGKAILQVEILQQGAPQATGSWTSEGYFTRRITFGGSRRADLSIPFASLPGRIDVFEIRKNKIYVILDPRTEGFVNRGREFADVRDFLKPRGAISAVASIDDPLLLELLPGSRGALRIYGFEIIFKYSLPARKKQMFREVGAGHAAFAYAPTNISIERNAPWIAALAAAVAIVPFSIWLLRSHEKPALSIQELPQELLTRLVDGSHYPLLPRILDDNSPLGNWDERFAGVERTNNRDDVDRKNIPGFRPELAPVQAAMVLRELQKRWREAELGNRVESGIFMFRMPYHLPPSEDVKPLWTRASQERSAWLEERRASDWFFRAQSDYPRLTTEASGAENGSFRVRLQRRLGNIYRMRAALASLIRTEQRFVSRYYKDDLNFYGPGDPLYVGEVFIRPKYEFVGKQPSAEFQEEITRFVDAEILARKSKERQYLQESLSEGGDRKMLSTLWLKKDGAIDPDWNASTLATSGVESGLVQNANYSIGSQPLPPAPTPTPRIDRKQVEYVLVSHKEEVRACYEAALRRNPKASGTVRIKWIIDLRGRVRDPKVMSSEIEDSMLIKCLSNRILGWGFPRPVNGQVAFEYPFQFVLRPR